MARAHTAYLSRRDVPDRAALQTAIDALKLKLVVDEGYAPFASSGYLPCTLHGEDAGFTIRFRDVPADLTAAPTLAAGLGGRDVAVEVRWGGDVREQVSALGVCAALAGSFGALVHDADKDALLDAGTLAARARAGLEEL